MRLFENQAKKYLHTLSNIDFISLTQVKNTIVKQ